MTRWLVALVIAAALTGCTTPRAAEGVAGVPMTAGEPEASAPEASPTPTPLTSAMKAACRHAMAAVVGQNRRDARGEPDWKTAESEMYAAWKAGKSVPDALFVAKLLSPGSLVPGDTQTLAESIDTLAIACGIPLFYD